MSRELPARPNLEHLKKQAKELLEKFRAKDADAVERFRSMASYSPEEEPGLSDAQHLIAKEHGFATWGKLKEQVELRSGDPHKAFSAAVRNGKVKEAAQILEANPGLKARLNEPLPDFGFGQTALQCAVHRADREMLELLLGAGADINKRSEWWAGSFGVLDEAWRAPWLPEFLLARGAKLDANSASRLGMFGELKAMVEENPELVHARGGDGQTPLHVARSVETAEFLLDHGADIDALDVDHESTPAQYLIHDAPEVVQYLMKRGCQTDILMASAVGDLALVRKILDENPEAIRTSVSSQYFPMKNPRAGGTIYTWTLGSNKTAHEIAKALHHEDVLRLLTERSPEEVQLAVACEAGDEKAVDALLRKNPNPGNSLSVEVQRRLISAATNDNLSAVRLMLASGWPADVRDNEDVTPLHWAGFHGNREIAKELLKRGAPVDIVEKTFNARPLGWATYGSMHSWRRAEGDYPGTMEAMLQAGAAVPEELADELSGPVRAVLLKAKARKKSET